MRSAALPERPWLDQLRRQAKELLRDAVAGDEEALARFAAIDKPLTLTSAQLALARWYGHLSWARLKAEAERTHRRRTAAHRDDELPAVLGLGLVVGRSVEATVALSAVRVYTTGCVLEFDWAVYRTAKSAAEWEAILWDEKHGYVPTEASSGFDLDVTYADGGTANVHRSGWPTDDGNPFFHQTAGRSGGDPEADRYHGQFSYFLGPIPPPGDLRIDLVWPKFGVERTTTIVDAGQIIAAVDRIQSLQPEGLASQPS